MKIIIFAGILIVSCAAASDDGLELQSKDAVKELHGLVSELEVMQPDTDEVSELRNMVSEFEATSAQIAALKSGVQLRGTALTAAQVERRIENQSTRVRVWRHRIQTSKEDENDADSLAEYEKMAERARRAQEIQRKQQQVFALLHQEAQKQKKIVRILLTRIQTK